MPLPKGHTDRAGDSLAVLPTNPMEIDDRVLQCFHLFPETLGVLNGYLQLAQPISPRRMSLCWIFFNDLLRVRVD